MSAVPSKISEGCPGAPQSLWSTCHLPTNGAKRAIGSSWGSTSDGAPPTTANTRAQLNHRMGSSVPPPRGASSTQISCGASPLPRILAEDVLRRRCCTVARSAGLVCATSLARRREVEKLPAASLGKLRLFSLEHKCYAFSRTVG